MAATTTNSATAADGSAPDDALLLAAVADLARDLAPASADVLPPPGGPVAGVLAEAGFTAMRLPDAHGGADATVRQVALVARELARHLVPEPFAGPVLAAELCRAAGVRPPDGATVALAADLSGPHSGAPSGPPGSGDPAPVAFDATGARCAITVRDGRLVALPVGEPLPGADLTRPLAACPPGPGTDLGPAATKPEDTAAVSAYALTVLAADLTGTARGALDDALAHVLNRRQFGRPVGAFQAVRHLAADAEVALAAAEALWRHAARCADATGDVDPATARRIAAVAKTLCAEIAVEVCESAVQMFGGIALTWEHLAHVRLRRALLGRVLYGDARTHLADPAPLDARLDLLDTPEQAAFRAGLRDWLTRHPRAGDDGPAAWHRALHAAGYVGLRLPAEDGGQGLTPVHEAVVNEELGAARALPAPPIGHIAGALRLYGDPGQRARHLTTLLSGEVRWCQGFSEPGAGSDLAAITTRARHTPRGWVVNGSKIWTSDAVDADRCLLLARTADPEPGVPGHRGLGVLLVDMRAPGVVVRPITTAFGTTEFAQVFFDDVVVPHEDLLGEPGDGWAIAMDLLGYERGPADIGWTSRIGRTIADLRAFGPLDPADAVRAGRAEAWLLALQLHVRGRLDERGADDAPGPEGSIDKLLLTRVDQHVRALRLELAGAAALTGPDPAGGPELTEYLWSRAGSIYGGTAQIQRDIVGHRVLGLPRE